MFEITRSHLVSLLEYNPEDGIFRWRFPAGIGGRTPAGSAAGKPNKSHGYVLISILGTLFPAHRLAWLYMTGEMPKNEIDHINRIRHDNRWANLRCATTAQNLMNKNTYNSNTSGQAGVSWHKRICMWQARIGINGKRVHLGYFKEIKEAALAYNTAKLQAHTIAS